MFPGAKPQDYKFEIILAGSFEESIHTLEVEFALFRFQLSPMQRAITPGSGAWPQAAAKRVSCKRHWKNWSYAVRRQAPEMAFSRR